MSGYNNYNNNNQAYDPNALSNDLSKASLEGGNQNNRFNPSAAPSFTPNVNAQSYVPGQYGGGYSQYAGSFNQYAAPDQQQQQYSQYNQFQSNRGGYSNQYNNRGGFNNNYNSYNQYSQQQPVEQSGAQGMSLEEYTKQQQSALNSKIPTTKPKVKLNMGGIKIVKREPKPEVKEEVKEAAKEAAKEEVSETKTEPVAEAKETPKEDAKEETKEAPVVKEAAKPVSAPKTETKKEEAKDDAPKKTADLVAKQQEEEIDISIVKDMYGGKDHLSIIFMGHVDAGKSTMGGNILFLTGAVDKRTVEKYEREAKDAGRQGWYLSWIMDTNKEERNDGKTIEVGKSYFETDKRRYTILDAPGHKMYVSEMIGGASQADIGILVISARKGEYEAGFEKGGQSREHAILAKTQGVNRLVVVINKMDDPTVNWSNERYTECITKLAAYLKGVGYGKNEVVYMPVSGYTGAGLKDRVPAKECPWYSGPSLLEYLDSLDTMDRKINAPFMLPISGKMKDLGTVVEGKIESGHIKKSDSVLLMPNRTSVEILAIYNEVEEETASAFCGDQVRLRIKGVEEEDVSSGYVLTSSLNPVKTATRFEAQIAIVELKSIMATGFACVMHIHTAIEEVAVTKLLHKLEKGTNRKSKKPPAFAKKGMKIIAILETNEPVCMETFEDHPQLGRFTLRDQGQTIAIGKVTKLL
ncbi:unnamed protein product [Kuraishia capsulata CBS 1993]|uniref:Eukaryotic peptide chain release factor GTP-binding subunit n=1 Tax=Kuraishia capsulata CBS 1993 TaxID=1382522 RepID=W6MU27_9ASCO|nr:uncharacterized protein KUCA_T00001364001 [Kuraishia capsulata CBS 1993]CDK25395.1 unnamed protein product [Kuraishia capsulata CBS 1993]